MILLSWGREGLLTSKQWLKKTAMVVLVSVMILTCWLQTGLWRAEARATRLLSDFLAANPEYHQVFAEKLVDPFKICPRVGQLHGQPWVLTFYVGQPFGMDHPGQVRPEIKDTPSGGIPSLIYDYKIREWKVSPATSAP